VGPLLEEWGIINALNVYGLGYLRAYAPEIVMRPLHLTPYAMEWALGNGYPIGVAAGTGVFLVMRYLVARWAISPFFVDRGRWVVATLAAVLFAWPGAWLGRFASAHLSAVFFFAALGFAIRLFRRWSFAWATGCVLCTFLLLMTYQGLALCLIAIPFFSLLWHKAGDSRAADVEPIRKINKPLSIFFAVALGFAIYGIYCFVMFRVMGNGGYVGTLATGSGRLLSPSGLWTHISAAFATVYGQNAALLPFLLLLAFLLYRSENETLGSVTSQVMAGPVVFLLVALLPLLSLIYVSELHIGDVDRVLFPVSVGFVLVCLTVLRQRTENFNLSSASVVVVALLTAAGLVAHQIKQYDKIQSAVIDQTLIAISRGGTHSVVIRDMTGMLGDVYTLLPPVLTDALAVHGKNIAATICTPSSVDRLHPVALRYPIQSTQRCEELPAASDNTLVLSARLVNGQLIVEP
jgi:hypothetical protein